MERFSGGGVEMRFFTDLEESVLRCGDGERGEDDEYGGPTRDREREREESVCAVDVGVFLCVVWFDRCPMIKG